MSTLAQRHNIYKKRLDPSGEVIKVERDGVNEPKVCGLLTLRLLQSVRWPTIHLF